MSKPPKDDLAEAKRIAARMLAMPPQPHKDAPKQAKAKPKVKEERRSARTVASRKG